VNIVRAYRTELDPTRAQVESLLRHAGVARWAYNWGLARRQRAFRESGVTLDAMKLHKELNTLKKTDFPWLYAVSKCAPQEALRDLDRAFLNFWRARRTGKRCGLPRFKSRKRCVPAFRLTGKIHVYQTTVQLPRLGKVRLKESGYLPTDRVRVMSATVTERAGRWFVALSVAEDITVPRNAGPIIGVDIGVSNWFVTSEGARYVASHEFERLERRIARTSRQLSRARNGSKNYAKLSRHLAKLHLRAANIRSDVLHKTTTELAKTKSVIVIEDLNVAALLRNHRLARALSARSFGMIRRLLEYKSSWYGSTVVVAPRIYPSSKMCSCRGCGYVLEELALSQRLFQCPQCGCSRDRDLNAALNLRNVAVSSTDTQNACGGDVRPSVGWQLPVNRVSEGTRSVAAEERFSVSITLTRASTRERSTEQVRR
jgi:putative transposase